MSSQSTNTNEPSSTATDVYTELIAIFATRTPTQILDFDILPSNFGFDELGTPLLRDGNAVGVTKKALVKSFVKARLLFLATSQEHEDVDANDASRERETLHATGILLLLHPEHLTACNWRKKRLVKILRSSSDSVETNKDEALQTELTFTTSFLRSPLHRHSKSPTLWSHRKWVLERVLEREKRPQGMESDGDIWTQETGVVLQAARQHPKNYYAFSYLRCVFDLLAESSTMERSGKRGSRSELAAQAIPEVQSWCLDHPADASAWSFLQFLVDYTQMSDDEVDENRVLRDSVRASVLAFAKQSGWQGESLWSFLMDMAGKSDAYSLPATQGGARRWQAFMSAEQAKFDDG